MTPLEKLKSNTFIGLFGKRAGLKLMHWLDPCCNTFCTDVTACAGTTLTATNVQVSKALVQNSVATAVDVDAVVTAEELAGGLLTSTSAAAVAATLPDAADLAVVLGAQQGSTFDFIVDNTAGANTVTVVVGTGITVGTAPITGGDTLTVSTANGVGVFRLVFYSLTQAILRRIA